MRYLFIILLLAVAGSGNAQEIKKDSLFMVSYVTGPSWDLTKPPNAQPHFEAHSKHLSTLRKNGVIVFGARAGEEGIIIFSASTFEAAQELINNDVAVMNGLFKTDIQKLNVFYSGCIEK